MKASYKFENNKVTILGGEYSKIVIGILSVVLFALTWAVFWLMLSSFSGGLKLIHVILMSVFAYCIFLFLRIITWNIFGREYLWVEDEKIKYQADYKFYTAKEQAVCLENMEMSILGEGKECQLVFKGEKNTITTAISLQVLDCYEIIMLLGFSTEEVPDPE